MCVSRYRQSEAADHRALCERAQGAITTKAHLQQPPPTPARRDCPAHVVQAREVNRGGEAKPAGAASRAPEDEGRQVEPQDQSEKGSGDRSLVNVMAVAVTLQQLAAAVASDGSHTLQRALAQRGTMAEVLRAAVMYHEHDAVQASTAACLATLADAAGEAGAMSGVAQAIQDAAADAQTMVVIVQLLATAIATDDSHALRDALAAAEGKPAKEQAVSSRYVVGQKVERRDKGKEWSTGLVTSVDPLKVTVYGEEKPDAKGYRWDEVRPIQSRDALAVPESRGAPAKDASARRLTANPFEVLACDKELAAAGVGATVFAAMQRHAGEPRVQRHALRLLVGLATAGKPAALSLARQGAVSATIGALAAHGAGNEAVQLSAAACMAALAPVSGEEGAMAGVVEAVETVLVNADAAAMVLQQLVRRVRWGGGGRAEFA